MIAQTAPVASVGSEALGQIWIFIMFLIFIFIIIGAILFIFWVLMIIDVAKRKFKEENEKIIWILVIVLAGIIGAVIYYFAVKRPSKH